MRQEVAGRLLGQGKTARHEFWSTAWIRWNLTILARLVRGCWRVTRIAAIALVSGTAFPHQQNQSG